MKKTLIDILNFCISTGFLYLFFTNLYFFIIMIVSITILGILWYIQIKSILNKFDDPQFVKFFKDDMNIKENIKKIYPYNFFARLVLIQLMTKLKNDNNFTQKIYKNNIDDCMKELDIVNLNKDTLKYAWKKNSKIFHPDNFQDENDKKLATQRFQKISECYEKLKKEL